MDSRINNYNLPNSSSVDSINENITYSEGRTPATSTNSRRVTTVLVNNQTNNSTTFVTKLVNIFKRIISALEITANFLNIKFNDLLDAIKQIKLSTKNNHFKFKVANFSLIINKPVYIINY